MKLFAVGTEDPNPDNWNPWNEIELYAAKTRSEALILAGYNSKFPCVEVDMSKAKLIMKMPDYRECGYFDDENDEWTWRV